MAWCDPAALSTTELEEGSDIALDFGRFFSASGDGVVPVVAQDVESRDVLVLAHANRLAVDYTLKHGVAAFWSLSRDRLWIKGETSGNFLDLVEVRVNCEQNSLLYLVNLRKEGVCHTVKDGVARHSCYYRRIFADRLEPVER
ncbi:MAG: phosphoribosyl-AMP cyclohydrolase [Chloroflexota bacterium]|nr:phosphoribosyl-AMP cyclohydrolase [Chloroflexota bacterium]MDE2898924.1 phosphoribosyl-AMP cyclohydrolase [Chloroflexota bacterium]